ncbi:hypothetical protein [Mesorhizobium sp. M0847]|uniref:hypothetical protein n=1 Tax=unclassified Mesorhizobium TaxID=325217 RepID=UPI0033355125
MSTTRSPNYPAIDLGAAIEAVEPVFLKEKRNKMPRLILAQHLGYGGLNGRALGVIGALRAYGLMEGTGDDTRVSEDAIILLNAPADADERHDAMERCAFRPNLFKELRGRFPDTPSEGVLKYTLIKMDFTPEAAGKATQNYLATLALVADSPKAYNPPAQTQEDAQMEPEQTAEQHPKAKPFSWARNIAQKNAEQAQSGMRQEVITLDEGDVVISFPEALSFESFQDLEAHLQLFVKKMQRRTKASKPTQDDGKSDDGSRLI